MVTRPTCSAILPVTVKFMSLQIEPKVVVAMSEEDLSKYITKLGDRIAVRQFCEKAEATEGHSLTALSNTAARLKEKIEKRKNSGNCSDPFINAAKQERRFEIGWRHFDGSEFTQRLY